MPSLAVLNDDEIDLMFYVEQVFWESGGLPSVDQQAKELGLDVKDIEKAWRKERFVEGLKNRGLPVLDVEDKRPLRNKDRLTPTQVILANMLVNFQDKRSVREKLKSVNVNYQTYQAWLRQPGFSRYLQNRVEQSFGSSDHIAFQKFQELVEKGDFNAIKLFMEMRGHYNPRLDVNVNIQGVILRVVEIIQKHVTDPVVLGNIAEEMSGLSENVLSGGERRMLNG